MSISKLHSILQFISFGSIMSDMTLLAQSPDYLMEKFNRYIGDESIFEFPKTEQEYGDAKILLLYSENWGNINESLKSIIIFLNRANWDSRTLPSEKVKIFEEYIGDCSLINDSRNGYGNGLHILLNRYLGIYCKEEIIKRDLLKLNRDFNINSALKIIT